MNRLKNILQQLALPFAFILFWEISSNTGYSAVYLPSFSSILENFYELLSNYNYWKHIATTFYRFFVGFLITTIFGIPIGLLLGWNKNSYRLFEFLIEFFRPLPSASVIPIAILFLGIGDNMKIFVIAFGSFWPILINTIDGVRNIEPLFLKTAKVFEINKLKILKRIILPSALPQIFSGLKISIAISLILAITVEMIVGGNGIGYFIIDAERSFQFKNMYAGVFTIGIIGYLLNLILNQVEKWILYWK